MVKLFDGPSSSKFVAIPLVGSMTFEELVDSGISEEMTGAVEHAPCGEGVAWGIPFEIGAVVVVKD